MTTDSQPTLPLPPEAFAPAPRRRRRVWPWIVAAVVVIALLVAAVFVAESVAKALVAQTVRDQVRSQLALPGDQPIDVQLDGPILPQLISGTLGEVRVSSDDVAIKGITGDVAVTLHDIDLRGGYAMSGGEATVTMDAAQLRTLLSSVDGFPADSLGLAAPNVTMTFPLSVFGAQFPVGVALTPSASGGNLVLTPDSLQLGGVQVSADVLRQRFGSLADGVLRDWTVCIADRLPAGIRLEQLQVSGADLVASFSIDGAIATDPALQAPGTCSG